MKPFQLTGSRYYGSPDQSDWDILVDGTRVSPRFLERQGFKYAPRKDSATSTELPPDIIRSFYLWTGAKLLNAIWCGSQAVWLERLEARRLCAAEAPVTRDRAIEIHRMVEEEGPQTFTGITAELWRLTTGVA